MDGDMMRIAKPTCQTQKGPSPSTASTDVRGAKGSKCNESTSNSSVMASHGKRMKKWDKHISGQMIASSKLINTRN